MRKSIILSITTVIFFISSIFMSNCIIDIEIGYSRLWQAIPFWGLGIIAAIFLTAITYANIKNDFAKAKANKFAGLILAIPGFIVTALGFKQGIFVTETSFPLFGTLTEFMFGVFAALFVISLLTWSVLFFSNQNNKKNKKHSWFDFFNLKFKDLIWVVVPFVLSCLDSWIIKLMNLLQAHADSFRPLMTIGPPKYPIYVRIFAYEAVPSILYLLICTAIFMFLCNYEKINKAVAISVIILCVFGILRYYLRLLNFSGDLMNKLLLGGLPISAVLLSMPLAISIKSLFKRKIST